LTGSLATITNGIAYTNLYAQGAGGGNQFYYSTTQKGTFPWSPCQAPANGVLPSGLNRISATFNLTNFVPFGSYRYHIYIGLYYWLPNGAVTAGGHTYRCLDTQSRVENINGVFSVVGTNNTYNPGDSFGYDKVTLGAVSIGSMYTLSADVQQQCQADEAAWGIPTTTICQLAGVEIGVEGYQFTQLSVSWPSYSFTTTPPPGLYFDNVVTVLFENTGLNQSDQFCTGCYVLGNTNAANMNAFWPNHALATEYFAITHPSAPNYESLLGAEFSFYSQDCSNGNIYCTAYRDTHQNLVDLLTSAGLTWTAYAESGSNPGQCTFTTPRHADHFPFLMFADNNVPSRCTNFQSATAGSDTELISSLNSASPSNFYWLTPIDSNNCHDDPLSTGISCDAYFNTIVNAILGTTTFTTKRAALIVTFDEGGGLYTDTPPHNYVYTVFGGPQAKTGFTSALVHNHYSWLSTMEANWGFGCLQAGDDCASGPMYEFFNVVSSLALSPSSYSFSCPGMICTGASVLIQGTITLLDQTGLATITYTPNFIPLSGYPTMTGPASVGLSTGRYANFTWAKAGGGTVSGTFSWTVTASLNGESVSQRFTLTETCSKNCPILPK